jgi:hypothetical protein
MSAGAAAAAAHENRDVCLLAFEVTALERCGNAPNDRHLVARGTFSATTSGSAGFTPLVLTTLISSALTLPAAASAAMIASPAATAVRLQSTVAPPAIVILKPPLLSKSTPRSLIDWTIN